MGKLSLKQTFMALLATIQTPIQWKRPVNYSANIVNFDQREFKCWALESNNLNVFFFISVNGIWSCINLIVKNWAWKNKTFHFSIFRRNIFCHRRNFVFTFRAILRVSLFLSSNKINSHRLDFTAQMVNHHHIFFLLNENLIKL